MDSVKTVSPLDGRIVIERPFADMNAALSAVAAALRAQTLWHAVPVADRVAVLEAAIASMVERKAVLAAEITLHMGRPISQSAGEIDGMAYRARHMLALAAEALADREEAAPDGRRYFIRRQPHGTVLAITPWNYPYLTAVNSIIPALAAGNAVILKPSPQTPTIGEHFAEAFKAAGVPEGVFQSLHLSADTTLKLIETASIHYVGFTGSVAGGTAVEKAAAGRFLPVGLELGGKDAAYVRADADIDNAVANLVDGALFNSGQSCCGIERIYVAEAVYDQFIAAYAALVQTYRLGDPQDPATTLGPVVSVQAAERIRAEIGAACAAGAEALIPENLFPAAKAGTAYVAPQVLVKVDHTMAFMREETFGPCVGIMAVQSDGEAISRINDSPYGLTASLWTEDTATGLALADQVNTGTVYLNRCDALEPALAWAGVKHSGRGCTLSRYGYDALTRAKSFNIIDRS
ncbi:aldehyde dehydrogenase family protein [Kordiimonas pumila]|nr:aldehyde dehydrogenase family protein [Kordiimonas pumila]